MPAGALPDPRGIGRILPYWKNNISGGELVCPENLFRTSGDIRNSWASWFGNLQSTTLFQEPEHPISQPGCWAYPGATTPKCNIHLKNMDAVAISSISQKQHPLKNMDTVAIAPISRLLVCVCVRASLPRYRHRHLPTRLMLLAVR